MVKVLVTGSAGFIGYHVSQKLLLNGFQVIGLDGFTNYYDVQLKEKRNQILEEFANFTCLRGMLNDTSVLDLIESKYKPQIIIHLAAQAGVRYSITNPDSYIESNIVGSHKINELSKNLNVDHLLIASTSSVYGINPNLPVKETDNSDFPISVYAATKKSTEVLSHSYSHIYNIPTTIFRFFTVYGPWGRPDMALFKFTKAIIENKTIDVYNHGEMSRDFTYIDDIVNSIYLLTKVSPKINDKRDISNKTPFKIVNIGNSKSVSLMTFINSIEKKLNKKATINFMDMQTGDVQNTLSDTSLLKSLIKSTPNTPIEVGVNNFIDWYLEFYEKNI